MYTLNHFNYSQRINSTGSKLIKETLLRANKTQNHYIKYYYPPIYRQRRQNVV